MKNNLYKELEDLKKTPEVRAFAHELVQRHLFLSTLDSFALLDELLELAYWSIEKETNEELK